MTSTPSAWWRTTPCRAAPGATRDERVALATDLRAARDTAQHRLAAAVSALETIRLHLLRLHAGAGNITRVTADLMAARDLSDDIERLLEGGEEVERLLRKSPPSEPAVGRGTA